MDINKLADKVYSDDLSKLADKVYPEEKPRGHIREAGAAITRSFLGEAKGLVGTTGDYFKTTGQFITSFLGPKEMGTFERGLKKYFPFEKAVENIKAEEAKFEPTRGGLGGWALNTIAGGGSQLGINLAIGSKAGLPATMLNMFAVSRQNTLDEGGTELEANLTGLAEAALETWGVSNILKFKAAGAGSFRMLISNVRKGLLKEAKGNLKNIGTNALKSAVVEGLEEASQSGASLAISTLPGGKDIPRKPNGSPDWWAMLKQVSIEGAGGALVGFVTPTGMNIAEEGINFRLQKELGIGGKEAKQGTVSEKQRGVYDQKIGNIILRGRVAPKTKTAKGVRENTYEDAKKEGDWSIVTITQEGKTYKESEIRYDNYEEALEAAKEKTTKRKQEFMTIVIPKKLEIGQKVRPADRNNIGTITSIDKDLGIAKVHFKNKKTGLEATKTFALKDLKISGKRNIKVVTKQPDVAKIAGQQPEIIQNINKALLQAKEIVPATKAEQKSTLKRRVGAAAGTLKQAIKGGKPAEESIFRSTGLLKGPQSTQRFESIRNTIEKNSPGSIDELFRSIYNNSELQYFDIIDTANAFKQLIDGEPMTLRQIDLIKNHFGIDMGVAAYNRVLKGDLSDRLITIWKAGLLTGIKTSGLNTFSNLTHALTEVAKDVPAAAIDSAASLFTHKRTTGFTLKGLPGGVVKGFKKGWNFLKTGYDERNIARKYDYKKIKFGDSKFAKGLQTYCDIIFRFLGAQDQIFYYGALSRSLHSQAIAQGKNNKLKGKELQKYVENSVQNPTDTMLQYAAHDAEVAVFQNKTVLGDIAASIQKTKIGQLVVPFGRTPSAVATQIINYSPIGAVKTIVENIHKGKFDQRKFSQGLGRSIVGTGILYIGSELLKAGLMALSFPRNEKERKLWEIEGRKPNAIKIGNKWRSVMTLGPAGSVLLVGGYFQQAYKESGSPTKAIATAMSGGAKSFSEQTFLVGVNRTVQAITDPERSFELWFSNMAGSTVPTIVADIARATDTTERRTTGATQAIQTRIPGIRKNLQPRIDVFGNDLPRYGGNPLEVMIDPTRPVKINQDIVVDELRRLWDKGIKVSPTLLGDKDGYDILTPEENTVLWRRAGNLTYSGLHKFISKWIKIRKTLSGKYADLADKEAGKTIEKIVNRSKSLARIEAAKFKLNQGVTMQELLESKLVTNTMRLSQLE